MLVKIMESKKSINTLKQKLSKLLDVLMQVEYTINITPFDEEV